MRVCLLLASLALAVPSLAHARTIVLTNDDGLTSNLVAAFDALTAAGHDVIAVVPCTDQSGMGAALRFRGAAGGLSADCRNDAAKAGAASAGPMSRPGLPEGYFYVDGTPVMALLYGLDVLAREKWGAAPDLVISGPNEGRNVGPLVISSGTVSNAQYATARGVASIAVSAAASTAGDGALANPASREVASRLAELVGVLDRQSRGGRLVPKNAALNVNFPDDLRPAKWKPARIGSYIPYTIRFDPAAPSSGAGPLAGVDLAPARDGPAPSQEQDEAAVSRHDIAVTVMQISFDQPSGARAEKAEWLGSLFSR